MTESSVLKVAILSSAMALAAAILAGCGNGEVHSSEWYKHHSDALKKEISRCNENSYNLSHARNCSNAQDAVKKDPLSTLPKKTATPKPNHHKFFGKSYKSNDK